MILGIGTDICDIRRIERLLEKFGDRFKERAFTEYERNYSDEKGNPAERYAKRFAAKEAVAKALAGTKTGALSWQDVEVRNDPSGRPTVKLYREALNRAKTHSSKSDGYKIHLSLSDDYPYAQAFAVFESLD